MLQRIYGVAFPEEKQLKDYLHVMEEAEKRNHVKLGKEHDLFSMQDFAPGCVFFHPKGMIIINELMKYWHEEHHKAGYHEVSTPLILKKDLWLTSGHWDHYKNNMYFTKIDDEEFAVKPMNCPGGILVYKNRRHSYRELPLRLAEVGIVHRHELSGVLNGCFRVRKFSQDDAHIFCMEDQIQKEVSDLIGLIDKMYKTVGFKEYHLELSTRPEKAMGSKAMWDNAEKALKKALDSKAIKYKINEGDGAFYGPKIDFHIKDAIGRTWQCGTIQLDFQMPEKFELEYIAADDKAHRPVMLHRVIYGSLERFFGILIEHYAAAFPLWLSPEQVRVISVSDPSNEYSEKVNKELFDAGLRSNTDLRTETVSYKIRDAQLAKVPYMVVIGEKEVQNKTIAVRDRATGKTEYGIKLADFREKLLKEIEAKK
jgi:threonyl-tRNA synthetase